MEWVYLAFPGFMLARAIFKPRYVHGPEEPAVAMMNRLRAVVSLVTGLVLWAVYGSLGPVDAFTHMIVMFTFCGAVVVPLYLLLVAVMVLVSRDRRAAWSRMWHGPVTSIVLLGVLMGGAYLVTKAGFTPDNAREQNPLVTLVMFYLGIQLALAAFTIPYYAWVHGYRAIDGSPLLRPLVMPLFAWTAVVVDRLFGDWQDTGVPDTLALVTSVSGAVVVTLLAVVEYRMAARYHGIGFRSPPPPLLVRADANVTS